MATLVQQPKTSRVVRFDCFEADLQSGELRKRGIRIGLRNQSFQVLAALLEHPGEVVTRENLQQLLWHDNVFVDFETNLNAAVGHLREALNDSAEHPRFIETLPRRGYRFLAEAYAPPEPQRNAGRVRLVVLPFVNMSESAQNYCSDAMTDEIITALASLVPEHLAVIARTTAMHYKGTHKDVGRIGRELAASYVVEGGIRRDNDHASVNVQVIQTSDQSHVFARRYEAALRDIFQLHSSIAKDIAIHLNLPGIAEEVHRTSAWVAGRRQATNNIAAYNEYIQGRYLAERLIPEEMAKAKQHFEDAIRYDPEFALAHMALADLFSWLGYKGYMRPKDAYAIGITYALRAVEIDDTLAEAHAVLASYHKQLDYNWPAAQRSMARALELNHTSPFVRFSNAMVILMPHNRIEEAVTELRGALESDPLDTGVRCWLGIMLLLGRDYDAGIDEANYMRELEPNSCWPPFIQGIAYRQKYFEESLRGKIRSDFAEKAIAGHRRAMELAPGADHLLAWLGFALGVCGRKAEARRILKQFQRSEHYILPTNFAHVYLGLREIDTAFDWLDRAVEERDQNMMPILSYAHFDPLRSDPRFDRLLRKMKLQA
ncbi:MAG: winged helix-turn-helix domain-containing protein [Acidobacteriia bacterium]|nr:winged helix-turn-helix domain-containing protein [Terriglobia bacterium]